MKLPTSVPYTSLMRAKIRWARSTYSWRLEPIDATTVSCCSEGERQCETDASLSMWRPDMGHAVVALFLGYGAEDADRPNGDIHSALQFAVKDGSVAMVQALLTARGCNKAQSSQRWKRRHGFGRCRRCDGFGSARDELQRCW